MPRVQVLLSPTRHLVLYSFENLKKLEHLSFAGHFKQSDEPAALKALRNFQSLRRGFPLVPEHVETRSLFNPDKPGVEQVGYELVFTSTCIG